MFLNSFEEQKTYDPEREIVLKEVWRHRSFDIVFEMTWREMIVPFLASLKFSKLENGKTKASWVVRHFGSVKAYPAKVMVKGVTPANIGELKKVATEALEAYGYNFDRGNIEEFDIEFEDD